MEFDMSGVKVDGIVFSCSAGCPLLALAYLAMLTVPFGLFLAITGKLIPVGWIQVWFVHRLPLVTCWLRGILLAGNLGNDLHQPIVFDAIKGVAVPMVGSFAFFSGRLKSFLGFKKQPSAFSFAPGNWHNLFS